MIDIQALNKDFGSIRALRNLSLRLEKGRRLAVIGPTRAGKSVLLKILAGVYVPTKGRLFIDGVEAREASKRPSHLAHRIGMLFQQNALFDSLSVWENVAFQSLMASQSRHQAREEAETLLLKVGLPSRTATLTPADLSGGMRKRVGFARSIAKGADILLLDNPTAGLDPILSRRIDEMINRLALEKKATVMVVTNHMESLASLYDEVALLYEGRLCWFGTAQEATTSLNPYMKQMRTGAYDGPMRMQKTI